MAGPVRWPDGIRRAGEPTARGGRMTEAGAARTVIMTVDDDPGVSRAVARGLRRYCGAWYRIVRADSGESAFGALRELKPRDGLVAVILADDRMPRMTASLSRSRPRTSCRAHGGCRRRARAPARDGTSPGGSW